MDDDRPCFVVARTKRERVGGRPGANKGVNVMTFFWQLLLSIKQFLFTLASMASNMSLCHWSGLKFGILDKI